MTMLTPKGTTTKAMRNFLNKEGSGRGSAFAKSGWLSGDIPGESRTGNFARSFEDSTIARTKVLSIGEDADLLESRHLVLESAGFAVRSASSAETIDDREVREVHLVLICHSVNGPRAFQIARSMRSLNPAIPIIQLCKGNDVANGEIEQIPSNRPGFLIREIERALSQKRQNCGSKEGV